MTIREVELFKAVDVWATKECGRQGLTPDGGAKRRILGETIVEQIRFPVMEQKQFASVVLDSGILTPKEVIDMMKHFNSVLTSPVGFHGDKRVGTLLSCFRFCYLDDGYESDDNEALCLSVDKDIVLHGIRLFGSENNEYDVILTVKERDGGVIVKKFGKFSLVLAYRKHFRYYGFDVMFDPVNLRKNICYLIKAKIKGPSRSVCGERGHIEVKACDVKFFFRSYVEICDQFAEFWFKLP